MREEVWRHLPRERQMHSVRVAGTLHACRTGIDRRSVVRARCLVFVAPLHTSLNLHALYHIPPRSTCSGFHTDYSGNETDYLGTGFSRIIVKCDKAACAAAISSIDDAALSLMKTGFTVSPGRAAHAGGCCAYALQAVCMRACSGVPQGVQKRVWMI